MSAVASAFAGLLLAASATAQATTFFVSPAGSDANSGLSPGDAFATPARVQGAIVALKASHGGALPGEVAVSLADGLYALADTLAVGIADCGDAVHGVTWVAPGRGAVLSGGVALDAWTDVGGGLFTTLLPVGSPPLPRALFVRGGAAPGRRPLGSTPFLMYSSYRHGPPPSIVVPAGQVRARRFVRCPRHSSLCASLCV